MLLLEAQDEEQFGDEVDQDAEQQDEGTDEQAHKINAVKEQGAAGTKNSPSSHSSSKSSSGNSGSTRPNSKPSSIDSGDQAKLLDIIKSGGIRGFYTKDEMDYLLKTPNPSHFCKHRVDPVNIWKDPQHKVENLIGKGGFGRVYKGIYTDTSKGGHGTQHEVAVKYVAYERRTMLSLLKEINFMRRMAISRHHLPFYQCFYERSTDRAQKEDKRDQIIFMMALMNGDVDGLIKNLSKREAFLRQVNFQKFMVDMAKGIRDMHWMGVLHRDIKPDNFLINKYNNPIVADLGLSEFVGTEGVKGLAGTPYYMAPEVMDRGKPYNLAVDVYSLGVSFYAFLIAARPDKFVDFQLPKDGKQAKAVVYYHFLAKSKYLGLIQAMTDPDPANRPKMEEVVNDLSSLAKGAPSRFPAKPVVSPPPESGLAAMVKRERRRQLRRGAESRLDAIGPDWQSGDSITSKLSQISII